MKTSLLLCLASLVLAPFASAEQTINYPAKKPFFSISFPDDWMVETGEDSVSASSADELVNMELIALEAEALDSAIDIAKESLSEELKGIKFTGAPEKGELNGMPVVFLNAQVKLEGIKMAVNCAVFAPKKVDTFFMLFNILPLEALEEHGEDVSKVLNSIREGSPRLEHWRLRCDGAHARRESLAEQAFQPRSTMKHALKILAFACSATLLVAETAFEPWSYTEKDLFPSAIVATATVDWNGEEQSAEDKKTTDDPKLRKHEIPIYGDENGWLAVELTGLPKGAQVEVEISIDGFMRPSKWKGKISKAGDARIFPKAAWDYAALLKVRQQRPVNATFKVTVNGTALPEENETCLMKSVNDCPFYVLWDEDGEDIDDFSWMFAAYVNENHPLVDGILKEALESGLVSAFTGYQSGDPDEVLLQVFAIWNVLQRRGIKYSDVSTTTPSKFVISQTVRFLDESINATQANCVDGSVLLASVLRKIGINPYLVMIPGHCFLAFDLGDQEDDGLVGIETTLIGNDNLKPVKDLTNLPEKVRRREFQASFKTFNSAIDTGIAALEEHADEFESAEDPGTQLISISNARELGIMPIAPVTDKP